MLAKNIAHQAVLAGHSALFTTAADLLLDLNGQETARALERRLRHYNRPTLLVVDEVGYLGYDARAADLIFQLVSRRYEHRSLLITTNLPFKRWDTVFPNASCAVALIDRLTHHAEILLLEGQSFRRREAELSQQQRNRRRPRRGPVAKNDRAPPHLPSLRRVDTRPENRVFTRATTLSRSARVPAEPRPAIHRWDSTAGQRAAPAALLTTPSTGQVALAVPRAETPWAAHEEEGCGSSS